MRLIFFGRPGSGKGTYASAISSILKIPHISTGQMLRSEIRKGTTLGKLADSYIKHGHFVPDSIAMKMLKKRLQKKDALGGFILDGSPRTLRQAKSLEKISKIDLVINLELDERIVVEKTIGRRVCEKCGANYNIADIHKGKINMPPLLPKVRGVCEPGIMVPIILDVIKNVK